MLLGSIQLASLALVAVSALGAFSATSASAMALIHFTTAGTFEDKETGESHLETSNGKVVTCLTGEVKGEVTTEVHGSMLILFINCSTKISIITAPCSGTGENASSVEHSIHVYALFLLGSDKTTEDNPAILIRATNHSGEPEPAAFSCTALGQTVKFAVTGSLVGLIKNGASETLELSLPKGSKAGEQQDKLFVNSAKEESTNTLLTTATGAEKFENLESSVEFTKSIVITSSNKIQIEPDGIPSLTAKVAPLVEMALWRTGAVSRCRGPRLTEKPA
jgi:hypothetical protein